MSYENSHGVIILIRKLKKDITASAAGDLFFHENEKREMSLAEKAQ